MIGPATEEDKAQTLEAMRQVMREVVAIRVITTNANDSFALDELRRKAARALTLDEIYNERA